VRREAAIRRTRRILRRRTWTEAARYAAWKTRRLEEDGTTSPLSWPLRSDELEDVIVRWPRRYAWANARHVTAPIRLGIARHAHLVAADIPQSPGNLVALEFVRGSHVVRVAIDYDDLPVLHPDVHRADLYFKLQFRCGGYAESTVIPGGYAAPKLSLYRYARRWRALGERETADAPIFARFSPSSDVRRELLETVRRAGWASDRVVVGSSWLEYMHDLSRAPICLDAPGRGEICFRLVEALAVGACVVGPELEAELHVPTNEAVVRVRRDHSDLVTACDGLLHDAAQRTSLRLRAAEYFDRYLDIHQLGAYYVRAMLDASSSPH